MKKSLLLLVSMFIALATFAQKPVITFTKTTHDFGQINEVDGRVTTVFEFKNEGMIPLILNSVRASCGCTTPKWTKEPIEPGATGQITVTYNPNGRPGRFQKTITVNSNAPVVKLTIRGEVIPRNAKPVDNYPIAMGNLSLKSKTLDLGTITKGKMVQKSLAYTNKTPNNVHVEIVDQNATAYMAAMPSLTDVANKQVGEFQVVFDSEKCPLYGPIEMPISFVVDPSKENNTQYSFLLKANVVEDFSGLTPEQIAQAPIVEIEHQIDLGEIPANKKVKKLLQIKNVGSNPLAIRRVYTVAKDLKTTAPKQLKGGKKGSISMEINTTQLNPGQYKRIIKLITNDPKAPIQDIMVIWVVK